MAINSLRKLSEMAIKIKKELYLRSLINRGLKIGRNVNIIDAYFFDPSFCYLISIGNNCTICPNVRLIAHDASTYKALGYTKIGKISIEDGCFIGDSVIVLPGVHIGANSIIGAGSIVTSSIPNNSVAAGNPARVICSKDTYLNKIKSLSNSKRIFSRDYYIDRLDLNKRMEIIESVQDSIGFII